MQPFSLSRFDMSDKTAIVTGGTRGIGRAIVDGLADAGADVVVVSRKQAACEEVALEVATRTGRGVVARACHVGHWDELEQLVEFIWSERGGADVLVNNAGMSPLYDGPLGITETMYDKVLNVNLKGPVRLAILAGTRMAGDRGGSIINIGSLAALRPRADLIPYASAKAGLMAATVGLARALGPTVRVNCLVPGPFATGVTEHWDMEAMDRRLETAAMPRIGTTDEMVGAVIYLASDASSYTTGSSLVIDGGLA
jgi:NAD(P)-dependent dehydrogenase (short-subunit alcohol dehydrogenase family)